MRSRWKPAKEQKRKEGEEEEDKKGRRRQSRKTEAACVARFAVTTYCPIDHIPN